MQIAMYRGPAKTAWFQIVHWVICIGTRSRYSHCEIVIRGDCYTCSERDGGVRGKKIDLYSGHWDVYDIPGGREAEDAALRWFAEHHGEGYDWRGILRFVLPWIKNHERRWFCSEACAAALGIPEPHRITPQGLLDHFLQD